MVVRNLRVSMDDLWLMRDVDYQCPQVIETALVSLKLTVIKFRHHVVELSCSIKRFPLVLPGLRLESFFVCQC